MAFAPEENPEIAVAVFVEHGGHGSTSAAPIAKRIIETYYKQKIESVQKMSHKIQDRSEGNPYLKL